MTHPLAEIAAGVAVVLAVGVSTMLVLPRPKPEAVEEKLVLSVRAPDVERAEPLRTKTDAERVADLERQLEDLVAGHKALREQVSAIAEEIAQAPRRQRRARR